MPKSKKHDLYNNAARSLNAIPWANTEHYVKEEVKHNVVGKRHKHK